MVLLLILWHGARPRQWFHIPERNLLIATPDREACCLCNHNLDSVNHCCAVDVNYEPCDEQKRLSKAILEGPVYSKRRS